MRVKCVNGIDVDRLRATREIRLDAGRIARKIRKQLAERSVPGRAKPHQSMQILEE
ncbi:hypothetical protein SAMN05216411_103100 [Nitrosospira multiformis]|nr:hypothetical protein SAMN05216411_103100 [Nitrosospira multiformis]